MCVCVKGRGIPGEGQRAAAGWAALHPDGLLPGESLQHPDQTAEPPVPAGNWSQGPGGKPDPFTFISDSGCASEISQMSEASLELSSCVCVQPFPSVGDIIYHYSQSPLLLIDAKKRGWNQQNQCLLSDPAGYLMTGQNWT